MVTYRVALSHKPLPSPAPRESSSGVWVYEIEAARGEIAEVQAVRQWYEDMGLLVWGGCSPREVVLTLV
jgi:hypothetical protein